MSSNKHTRGLSLSSRALEPELHLALERHEFELLFQPVLDLRSGFIQGAEALLRWNHPVRGVLLPAQFLREAEEAGLMVEIGNWVLMTACQQAKSWIDAGLVDLTVSVNIAASQMYSQDLPTVLTHILAQTGLPAASLQVEVSETIAMQHADQTARILRAVKGTGVRTAFDNFGRGKSSLGFLKHFSLDTIKLDRSFIQDIASDPVDAAIVSGLIAIAHAIGLEVVAETVETEEQIRYLEMLHCDHAQGFRVARPVEAASIVFHA